MSTLYRQLSRLREVGLIHVIEERPARGTIERTYAAVPANRQLQREDVESAPIAQVRAAIRNFVANLTANVFSFVDSRAFAKDRTQLRSLLAAADLSDDEYVNVIRAIADAISAAKKRSAGSPTTRRSFYVVALPQASSL